MFRYLLYKRWVLEEKYIDGSRVSYELDNVDMGINVLNEVKEITPDYQFLRRERALKRILKDC